MPEKGIYLYCIIKDPEGKSSASYGARGQFKKFEIKGIEGKDIYTISKDELSAVVSDSEIKEYFITRENLLAHQKVIEEIFKKYEVLPISFGTVAKSIEDVKEKILKPKAEELRQALEETKGKAEIGLKVSWSNMSYIFQEIASNSQELKALKTAKDIGYQDKIAAGQLVANLLEEKRAQEKEKILGPLKKIAEDFKEEKILTEDMIFNGIFLVSKNKEKKFDREINGLAEKYGSGIKFKYIGPLPLFNFININLSL